ncbi:MAG TPA: LCP family protein, partial [Candidatus Dojkabacteria bacterium]|nr:LCP family protein [Candidatus Dojkabacteria bacterium]
QGKPLQQCRRKNSEFRTLITLNAVFFQNLLNKIKRRRNRFNLQSRPKLLRDRLLQFKNSSSKAVFYLSLLAVLVFILANIYPLVAGYFNFTLNRANNDGGAAVLPWEARERLTLLLVGLDEPDSQHTFIDGLTVLVIDPEIKKLGIFNINSDLNVYVPTPGASYNIRTLYNNKKVKDNELQVLISAVESLLALTINRYAVINIKGFKEVSAGLNAVSLNLARDVRDKDTLDIADKFVYFEKGSNVILQQEFFPFLASDVNGKDDQLSRQVAFFRELVRNNISLSNFTKIPQLLDSISKNVSTNLSKSEFFSLAYTLYGIREDQVTGNYTKLSASILADKKNFYQTYNPIIENIDDAVADIFFNLSFFKEQAQIEVLNGSGIKGLAQNRARWITNSGGRVIHIGNTPQEEEQSVAYIAEPEKFPYTVKEIKKIFKNKIAIVESPYRYRFLGDMVIVLGKDNY